MSSSSSIHLTNQESPTRWQDLPEVCWELVFDRLKHHHLHHDQDLHHHHRRPDRHLESVSLVCKQFLSISNRLRSSLSIIDPLILHSSSSVVVVLQRFHHLNRIDLVQFHGDLDFILTEIAQSGRLNHHLQALDISKQKKFPEKGLKELGGGGGGGGSSLKILICSRLGDYLLDEHLMVIADAFPYLEELDISYPREKITYPAGEAEDPFFTPHPKQHISDAGIVNLSSKLLSLRKLNISGINNGLMFYSSLLAISSNCVFLTHLSANHYIFLSQGDSPSIFYITHHLISLSITNGLKLGLRQPRYGYNGLRSRPRPRPLPQPPLKTIESSLVSSRNLSVLDFSDMIISDEFLFSVSKSAFPLKKLALSRCPGFTINGIESILCAYYRSLKHLDLQDSKFLTDQSVSDLSSSGYMHDLNFIGLDSCKRLTNSTFFTLARNCPSLQEIRMEGTSLGEDGLIPTEEELFLGKQNLAIRVLKFGSNCHLNDRTLEKIGYVCPKLESLDVSVCMNITEHGIHEIGKRCSEIRELIMVGCNQICDFLVTHNSSEFSKLEDLDASSSGISNGGLSKVGCNCIGLQRLVLNRCLQVTEKGVMEVVNKCKRLRELNLRHCGITSDASLSLIVFSRPSLRKIIPPHGIISDEQKDSFLRHGCMACDVLIRSEILK